MRNFKDLSYTKESGLIVDQNSKKVLDTKLPNDLALILGRDYMPMKVIVSLMMIFNDEKTTLEDVDIYLLDEELITQDEREIIIEALYQYKFPLECAQIKMDSGIRALREQVIGFMRTPRGIELAIDEKRSIFVNHMLEYNNIHWGEHDGITLYLFPDGMNMNDIMRDPLAFQAWYKENVERDEKV